MWQEVPTFDMSQHFLISSAAKTLSLAQVFRLSDAGSRNDVPECALG